MRIFTLLLGVVLLYACAQNEDQSLSAYLDDVIAHKEVYNEKKEQRIKELKLQLDVCNLSPEQEYEINFKLYDEFRKYRLDSAIRYMERNLVLAGVLDDERRISFSNLYLAQLYSFAGRSLEAERILKPINPKALPQDIIPEYYDSYYRFYQHYTALSGQDKYRRDVITYRDSLLMVADPASFRYKIHMAYRLMEQGRIETPETLLFDVLQEVVTDSPQYAEVTYCLGRLARRKHNYELEKKYYMLSAIADAKSATKENASFQALATFYYDKGDLPRAFKYSQEAVEDARFSNLQYRTVQMSKFYSIINIAHQAEEAKSKAKLQHYLMLISILTLILVLLFVFLYKQIRKLYRIKKALSQANTQLTRLNAEMNEKNTQLIDSNIIKEQYIARFFDLCSMYIDKMEDYRKSLNKLAQNRQMDELFRRLKSTSVMESELEELYRNFDAIFLNLYPTFVADFNALLTEDERIVLKSEDLLNKELRIYALLRLGITDSAKISSFLRCSLSTVYNYRTKIRNKAAISREDFEKMVMKIGVVHENGQ